VSVYCWYVNVACCFFVGAVVVLGTVDCVIYQTLLSTATSTAYNYALHRRSVITVVLTRYFFAGTDINLRTKLLKKTPLMVALEHNQLEVVDLLLKRGVMMHLELTDASGWTALHYAACFARVELSVVRFALSVTSCCASAAREASLRIVCGYWGIHLHAARYCAVIM
jgi:hypothetical protein